MSEITTKTQQMQKPAQTSGLAKYADAYSYQIANMANDAQLKLSTAQQLAVTAGAQQIYALCEANHLPTKALNHSNVSKVLFNLAMLGLNPNAVPHECYLLIRNNKQKVKDENGRDLWIEKPTVELGLEGDGNDALVRKYGVDVQSLSAPFIVREGDEFTLPYFDGEKMCPPTWKPKNLSGKPILVFYVLTKKDGSKEYPMADRESVAMNLKAHIINNLQGVDEKVKNPIIEKIDGMKLDELLSEQSLRSISSKRYNPSSKTFEEYQKPLISPAYLNPHSREEMLIRKMRNNCLKKYPKNFDQAFTATAYESTFEDQEANNNSFVPDPQAAVEAEFEEKANKEEPKSVMVPKEEPKADGNGEVIQPIDRPKVANPLEKTEEKEIPEAPEMPDWMF